MGTPDADKRPTVASQPVGDGGELKQEKVVAGEGCGVACWGVVDGS